MTDPAAILAAALPADPDDHGPVGVPSDALRALIAETTPSFDNPELDAMQTVVDSLDPLPIDGQRRILQWLTGFFGLQDGGE